MNSMIIQSKKVKKFWTDLTVGLKKRILIQVFGAQKAHMLCALKFCAFLLLCTKPDITEDIRSDHSKLKILKKFPKIKALIPSCDSKLIFFVS